MDFTAANGQVSGLPVVNALTVDVEDYFQVSAFEGHIRRDEWAKYPCRLERNMDRILRLFAERGVHATFFVLGWVGENYPHLVRNLAASGHEVASHGWCHIRVTQQTPQAFRQDVLRAKGLLEDLAGCPVQGYRAASYSIGAQNLWALDILHETGHRYSSSIYPIHHDLYGMPEAPRFAFRYRGHGILEIPVTTVSILNSKVPCGGGGYFRLFPYGFSRWALRRVNGRDEQAAVFYFHPWELDPDQPRQYGIGFKTRFRHYLGLHKTEGKLSRLLADFCWDRMDRVFLTL